MADNYLAYITLPADISKVTIGEIPELFANAIHSGVLENEPRQVTEVKKFPLTEAAKLELCNAPFSFPVSLTDNDLMELSKGVWKHLEPLKLPTLEEAWKPYFDAFMANPREDWRLDVLIINPYMNQQILWHHTVKEYQKNVKIAANGKLLKPFDPSTFLPSPNASGESLNSCYVTLENLREYAASLNIGVNLLEQSSGEDLLGLTIKDGLFHIRNANGSSTLSSAAYKIEKIAFNQRLAKGRYTLNDAAMVIEKSANVSASDMVNKLILAASKGTLKMYDANSGARWLYGADFNSTVRDFLEVTTCADLNSWLNENESLISWRFPELQSFVSEKIISKDEDDMCGLQSASCRDFRAMGNLNANEVTIEFVAGAEGGVGLSVSARNVTKRITLEELGLFDRRKLIMNEKGALLLRLARKEPLASAKKSKTAMQKLISNLCNSLKLNLGIFNKPIVHSSGVEYMPIITLIDNIGAADKRAEKEAKYSTETINEKIERARSKEIEDLTKEQIDDMDY